MEIMCRCPSFIIHLISNSLVFNFRTLLSFGRRKVTLGQSFQTYCQKVDKLSSLLQQRKKKHSARQITKIIPLRFFHCFRQSMQFTVQFLPNKKKAKFSQWKRNFICFVLLWLWRFRTESQQRPQTSNN